MTKKVFFPPHMFKNTKMGSSDLCLVEHFIQSKSLGSLALWLRCPAHSPWILKSSKAWGADYSGTVEWTQSDFSFFFVR